jgi:hypothetical protein
VTTHTDELMTASGETTRLVEDAQIMLGKLSARLARLEVERDYTTVRWLWKQIQSVERRAQERTASDGE